MYATPARRSKEMALLFSCEPRPEIRKRLKERVARGEVVSPSELAASLGAGKGDLDKLEAYPKDHGFGVVDRSLANLGICARERSRALSRLGWRR